MELDIKVYNNMIKNTRLDNVFLNSLNLEPVKEINDENAEVDVDFGYGCTKFTINENCLQFYPNFKVFLSFNEESVVSFNFVLNVKYTLEDASKYDDIYIEEFINRNLPINVWPYARETISSITTRIGFPALVIEPYVG